MRGRLFRHAWLAPAIAVALLLVANGLVFQATTSALIDETNKVARAQTAISSIDTLRSTLADAETGQRGYLLTGRADYLAPYTAARDGLQSRLAALYVALRGDAAMQPDMAALTPLVARKMEELQATIDFRRGQGPAAALRLVLSGVGKATMDSIRALLNSMTGYETAMLDAQRADARQAVTTTRITLVIATAIDVVLLTGLTVMLVRNATGAARVADEREMLLAREHQARADAEGEQHVAQLERARLETFFEAMTDAVVMYGTAGEVVRTNVAMRRLFAMHADDPILTRAVDDRSDQWAMRDADGVALPEERWPARRLLAGDVLTGADSIDLRIRGRNGVDILVNASGAPIVSAVGEITGAICVFRDESERRRLERAVRVERDTLRQVVDALPEAVMIADSTGICVVANQAARLILGLEMVGRPLLVAAPSAEGMYGALRLDGSPFPPEELPLIRATRGEAVRGAQLVLRNALSGADTPVLANSAPIRDEHGQVIGGVVVFQDISELKDLEAQKNDFLTSIAHDLKNPLTVTLGMAQVLLRRLQRGDHPDTIRLRDGLKTIERTTRTISQLLAELMDSSRLQAGLELTLDRQQVDLGALLTDLVEEYATANPRYTIRLAVGPQDLFYNADLSRLQRALTNVLANAIKYSPAGGEISITLSAERANGAGERAVIRIVDQGLGIPAADLPHIFDRFYRAGNVGAIAGTGIGLAGARQIVEQHGGTIAVSSEVGVGTTVTVRLPLGDAHPALDAPRVEPSPEAQA